MTPQERLEEARRRAMAAIGGLPDANAALAAVPPPAPVAPPSPSAGVDMALGRQPTSPGPQTPPRTPPEMRDVALGSERAAAPPEHPGYVFSQEEADAEEARQSAERAPRLEAPAKPPAVPNLPPGRLPQNAESALALDAPPETPGAPPETPPTAQPAKRKGSGRANELMVLRMLDSVFGGGKHDEELAALQARPIEQRREARAEARQQAQLRQSQQNTDRDFSLRQQAQTQAQQRATESSELEKAERDPTSEVSRNAQAEVSGMLADAGNFDPRIQALLTPERIGRMSAAELRDPRDPLIRGLVARMQGRAARGFEHENRTDEQGQRFAGQEELQRQRLSSEEERAAAREANRLAIAQLRARRRGAGGGGGAGVNEDAMREIVANEQVRAGLDPDNARRYTSALRGQSLTRAFDRAQAAALSGVQQRADSRLEERRAQARAEITPTRQAVQRAHDLASGMSDAEIRAALVLASPGMISSAATAAAELGAPGLVPGDATPRAREFVQAIAGFQNPVIHDLSGAQVTPTEFPRFQQQLGTGQFSNRALLMSALAALERSLDERDEALDVPLEARQAQRAAAQAPTRGAQAPAQGGGSVRARAPSGRVFTFPSRDRIPQGFTEVNRGP